MGASRIFPVAAACLLAACTPARPKPVVDVPGLPPATWHQVDFRADTEPYLELPPLPGNGCCNGPAHPRSPAVLDVTRALAGTPEARMIVSEGLDERSPQYHLLLTHANDRLRLVVRRVADRLDFDIVYPEGAAHVRTGIWSVELKDLTENVLAEMDPSRPKPKGPVITPDMKPAEILARGDLLVLDACLGFVRVARSFGSAPDDRSAADTNALLEESRRATKLFERARGICAVARPKLSDPKPVDSRVSRINRLLAHLESYRDRLEH